MFAAAVTHPLWCVLVRHLKMHAQDSPHKLAMARSAKVCVDNRLATTGRYTLRIAQSTTFRPAKPKAQRSEDFRTSAHAHPVSQPGTNSTLRVDFTIYPSVRGTLIFNPAVPSTSRLAYVFNPSGRVVPSLNLNGAGSFRVQNPSRPGHSLFDTRYGLLYRTYGRDPHIKSSSK